MDVLLEEITQQERTILSKFYSFISEKEACPDMIFID
jgi:hypothetical protein